MAEQFLNHTQIRPAFHQMRGEGMAERMGRNMVWQASQPTPFPHGLLRHAGLQPPPRTPGKSGSPARGDG